jgi:hypothetical protein
MKESIGWYYDKSIKDAPKYKVENLVMFNSKNL